RLKILNHHSKLFSLKCTPGKDVVQLMLHVGSQKRPHEALAVMCHDKAVLIKHEENILLK
ncbi:MAG: hypothetical protein ABFD02_04990, partial [Bacteroidales bacterium]